ncbi:MAG: hypothetical protein AAGH79_03590 [Bacteroidota bacterium]
MKKLLFLVLPLGFFACQFDQSVSPASMANLSTQDVTNFWEAFDSIQTTQDTLLQMDYLKRLFLDKASPGQLAMFEVRRYQPMEYLQAIEAYPQFWTAMRKKMEEAPNFAQQIQEGIDEFRAVYPNLKTPDVYFTVGVFRSPGTTLDSMVLIGAEMVLGDASVPTEEFPERLDYFAEYLKGDPNENVAFLNVHEVVHTQQQRPPYVLLYQSVYEGIAEYVAEQIMKEASTSPAISYGQENPDSVRLVFEEQMWTGMGIRNWLYNNKNNPFSTRDLGYYVGYAVAEKYTATVGDTQEAIADLIEIDYQDSSAFFNLLDQTGYLSESVENSLSAYRATQPYVVRVDPPLDSKVLPAGVLQIEVTFSEPMNPEARGFDYAPLGEDKTLFIQEYQGFSEDSLRCRFTVNLSAGQRGQLVLTNGFRSSDFREIRPMVLDYTGGPTTEEQ